MACFDFDTLPDRGKWGSSKWASRTEAEVAAGVVPMTYADMDLRCAPCIIRAVREAAESGVFGYTCQTAEFREALRGWMKRRHGWELEDEWVVTMPGVVPAMAIAVRAFTHENDKVLILKPGYGPFSHMTTANGRREVDLVLKPDENGRYSIDLEELRAKTADPDVTLMFMCSPHNPVGRIWTREELREVAKICAENHVLLACDEIHHDLIMPGHRFVTAAVAAPEYVDNLLVFTAPSKTFNLAGMAFSCIIIPDEKLRARFCEERGAEGLGNIPFFGIYAAAAAYREGDGWLDALMEYVKGNYELLCRGIERYAPALKVTPLEATYLAWVDVRALGMGLKELDALLRKAFFYAQPGDCYGEGGDGWYRINLALPRAVLEKALRCALGALKENGLV